MNITGEQLKWVWDTFGVSGVGLLLLWRLIEWVKPYVEKWFTKHFILIDTLTESAKNHTEHHETTHIALVCLGNAVGESATEENRDRVMPHITMLKDQMGIRRAKPVEKPV
jgi:hypothetical protein